MILSHIQKHDPTATSESAAKHIDIWQQVIDAIIKNMIDYSRAQMEDVHINLREEMALELTKLISFVSQQVVKDRLVGRTISKIDIETERQQCLGGDGKDKIQNTAKNCAEHIWIRKYRERWEPKTKAALRKEANPKKTKLSLKKVENNHFIPLWFIKKYWSKKQSVYKNVKSFDGTIETKSLPVGSWGFRKNLYSKYLEAYFGLLEGDAVRPIEMLLNVEPLNRPQREALIGFIVIQRLRNPYFMESFKNSVAPIVSVEVGEDKAKDNDYINAVYGTLYSQNEFYDKIARPIMYSRWVVVRSEKPEFVLPDICNIFGRYEERQYVLMPLTPNDCLIVLPVPVDEPRIVPHYIKASTVLVQDISTFLISAAVKDFLADKAKSANIVSNEEPNKIMQRIILSVAKITADE